MVMWDNGIKQGPHVVQFISGKTVVMDIERVILKGDGTPMFLVEPDGTKYNYANVLSTKLQDTKLMSGVGITTNKEGTSNAG